MEGQATDKLGTLGDIISKARGMVCIAITTRIRDDVYILVYTYTFMLNILYIFSHLNLTYINT